MSSLPKPLRHWTWIAILVMSSLAFSLVFACATPFAAFAVLAAISFERRDAAALVLGVWLINQMVGYGLLGYPQNAESFAWGGVIGMAALAALAGTLWTDRSLPPSASAVRWAVMLAVSFVLYEIVLLAAAAILSSGADAFSWRVIGEILLVNVMAFGGLVVCEKIALAIGLATVPAKGPAVIH
ncbi:MAG: hypothetical protein AB7R87_05375 [Parvibaculaceae bacterium]